MDKIPTDLQLLGEKFRILDDFRLGKRHHLAGLAADDRMLQGLENNELPAQAG